MDNTLNSKEAEDNVIAAILVNKENHKYIDKIDVSDFYNNSNIKIFQLIKELKQKEETIDILTVKEYGVSKKYNGIKLLETMSNMTDQLIYSGNIEKYIKILKNLSIKRKIFNISKTICEEIGQIDINEDETEIKNKTIQKYMNIKTNNQNSINEMSKVMIDTLEDIENKYQKRDDLGYRTGYLDLDRIIEGLHEQELTIIAARPRSWKNGICIANGRTYSKKRNIYIFRKLRDVGETVRKQNDSERSGNR